MKQNDSRGEGMDSQLVSRDNRLFSLYSTLPEWRKTEAVSIAAVSAYSSNLEYVPDRILSPEICRTALKAEDADLDILTKIPFPEVQKEAIKVFLNEGNDPFVVYSFADISDSKMAQDAVRANAYCIQLVPDNLLTKALCEIALKSPCADEKVSQFVDERFPEIKSEQSQKEENMKKHEGVKMKF